MPARRAAFNPAGGDGRFAHVRGSIGLAVVLALVLPAPAPAYPCFGREVVRCHDGSPTAVYIATSPPVRKFGFHRYFERRRVDVCDPDQVCDGVCTCTDPLLGDAVVRVGDRVTAPGGVCPVLYACKPGNPARCR
jgi:hypothetical protein